MGDGMLSAGESVDVPFVICLQQMAPFNFLVDLFGLQPVSGATTLVQR